jgi:hypothetical protein
VDPRALRHPRSSGSLPQAGIARLPKLIIKRANAPDLPGHEESGCTSNKAKTGYCTG